MADGSGASRSQEEGEGVMAAPDAVLRRTMEALELLLGRAGAAAGPGHLQETKHGDLLQSLRLSVATLEQKLVQDPHWGGLQRLRSELSLQTQRLSVSAGDVPWSFTCHTLLLLQCLKQCLALAAASCHPAQPNPKTAEAAPPLSPDTLSIAQEKTVQAALQFVVTLGLCPFLLPGVGLPLRCRTEFSAQVQDVVLRGHLASAMSKLYATCMSLMEIAQHPSLGSLVLTRHLGDLLAGLCQLGYCPVRRKDDEAKRSMGLTEEERARCRKALQGLLDRVYQPLVVQELLLLQGGSKQGSHFPRKDHSKPCLEPAPAWLRRLCGQLLSERLLKPGGVQAVVRGILEGAGAGAAGGHSAEAAAADWQKCDTVAHILSSCPQQSLSLEDYYQQVCRQVLQLFHVQDKLAARQFQRVATTTVLTMARKHPQQVEKYLLRPMLEPLLRCLNGAEISLEDLPEGKVLVKEAELSVCVENIYKVYVVGNEPSPVTLSTLARVLGAVFSLWCFTKQNVSFLRTPSQEILLWFLEKSERPTALAALEGFAQLGRGPPLLDPLCQFQMGSGGGVMITAKEAARDEDEDEMLYQKVCSEQWQLEQLVDLLSHCQSGGLTGDFFLGCLKELTLVAQGGAAERAPLSPERVQSLEHSLNPCQERDERKLRVLQLVALLCENISGTLFTDITQVVEFVAATLERACASATHGSEMTVEAQTLSMAMGLVAAMLGGAVQVKPSDFAALKRLVPLLEDTSQFHPEPVIQELATDLRIAICTHGAFCSETVSSAAQRTLGKSHTGVAGEARARGSQTPMEEPQGDPPQPKVATPQNPAGSNLAAKPISSTPEGYPAAPSGTEAEPGSQASPGLPELLLAAYDPDIPTRTAALRCLSRLIERRTPEARKAQEMLLKVFVENLEHEDSFVYLSAIQGLSLLSDVFPERVVPCLLAQYGDAPSVMPKAPAVETRMKVGEVLMRITRTLGDTVFSYRDQLIHAFLRGVRDPDSSLRASSLSNLGELCQILQFQLGSVVHEVASCLTAVVQTDREAEVRRAAVHVVVLLLRGLSKRALEVLQDVLLDLYRLLKSVVRCEEDEVTVLHAQLALAELDGIMRQLLFPPQSLEKKIEVLP